MREPQEAGFDELRVVTSARWLAADLAAAGVLPVRHDLGLDLRSTSARTAWWAASRFASRLVATTGRNHFTAPGPGWTANLPERLLGRRVFAAELGQLQGGSAQAPWAANRAVHVKLAEVKVPSLPAAVYPALADALEVMLEAGLSPRTMVQASEPIDLCAEYRTFVVGGRPVAASAYLLDGSTWDAWTHDLPPTAEALAFVRDIARELDAPHSYVLDVGRTTRGEWVVVEANPAWCANPYHCEPGAVVRAVLASQEPDLAPGYLWDIDPWLQRTSRPLPICEES